MDAPEKIGIGVDRQGQTSRDAGLETSLAQACLECRAALLKMEGGSRGRYRRVPGPKRSGNCGSPHWAKPAAAHSDS